MTLYPLTVDQIKHYAQTGMYPSGMSGAEFRHSIAEYALRSAAPEGWLTGVQIDAAADAWRTAKHNWQGHGNPPLEHLLREAFKAIRGEPPPQKDSPR